MSTLQAPLIPLESPEPEPRRPAAGTIPPLENGDHLSRDEFERRYHAMPHVKKAELIEGKVYMPSPVSHRRHSRPDRDVHFWLGCYQMDTQGVDGGANGTVRIDLDSEPQPDAYLLIVPERGGQARIDDDDYVAGAPELVVEIAASSVSYDLHEKLRVYRRNGVREYVVWRTRDGEIDWLVLRASDYVRLEPGEDGILRSETFPGLWLDPAALIGGDLRRVAEVVRQGCETPEHAAFAAHLTPTADA
jgi:Uma2 family endonuclease